MQIDLYTNFKQVTWLLIKIVFFREPKFYYQNLKNEGSDIHNGEAIPLPGYQKWKY